MAWVGVEGGGILWDVFVQTGGGAGMVHSAAASNPGVQGYTPEFYNLSSTESLLFTDRC